MKLKELTEKISYQIITKMYLDNHNCPYTIVLKDYVLFQMDDGTYMAPYCPGMK